MSLDTIIKIVFNQLRKKWGRTLLSALGIMIGVWAILSTVSLSQGLSDKVIVAVNSQSLVRLVQFYKTTPQIKSFEDLTVDTQFISERYSSLKNTAESIPEVTSYNPSDTMSIYLHHEGFSPKCVDSNVEQIILAESGEEDKANEQQAILDDQCYSIGTLLQPFDLFLANNSSNWYGSQKEPQAGEIALCYQCDAENPLNEALGADIPEDLIGKTVTLEYSAAPTSTEAGNEVDLTNAAVSTSNIKQSVPREYTITGVYDDRQESLDLASTFLNSFAYLNYSEYVKALEQNDDTINTGNVGYIEFNAFIDSFEDLDEVVETIRDKDFLVISVGQILTSSIKTAFLVLTIALGIFAAIALIAAVFGIINVMTISVLERQKEIGILKSLGSSNGDIFWIFLLESMILGFLGWIFGVLLTWGTNAGISGIFNTFLLNNSEIKDNLATLNITDFNLVIPWYILALTLALAVIFTTLSGLVPSWNAAKQNPTEVLRSE